MISYLNLINMVKRIYLLIATTFLIRNLTTEMISKMSEHYGWKIIPMKLQYDVINKFEKVFDSQDEPFPGIVTIAKDILIEKSYSNETKVILEGQGGDEI